jgi:glucose-1-phosphate adenylyltransferase
MKITTMIMAGGKGERLYPLTRDRAKPAVPFGALYRIIDFTLSNCINSNLRQIYVLTQYKSLSLDRHIQMGWNILNSKVGEYIQILSPQQRMFEEWYRGTADAIFQNIYTLDIDRPDLVLILSGDHVYKMDYRKLIDYHIEKGADLTVSAVEMPRSQSPNFGVIIVNEKWQIMGFQEKPQESEAVPIPGQPDRILGSMGVYVFNTEILVKRLIEDAKNKKSAHDFGKNVIPHMVARKDRVYAFSFKDPSTNRPLYWRDVGTIQAYWEAHMDLLDPRCTLDFFSQDWPILTYEHSLPPARISFEAARADEGIFQSIISNGCTIKGGRIQRSVLSPGVTVEKGAHIEESILLNGAHIGRGCRVRKAILEKRVSLPDGFSVGYDDDRTREGFTQDPSGIIVIPLRTFFK